MNIVCSFDLDGTLCTNHGRTSELARLSAMRGPIETWQTEDIVEAMKSVACDKETPLVGLARLVAACYVVSARPGSCIPDTHKWLKKHRINRYDLRMREDPESWRENGAIWKARELDRISGELGNNYTVLHFDDDPNLRSLITSEFVSIILCPWSQHV